jgi:hypothetical protein
LFSFSQVPPQQRFIQIEYSPDIFIIKMNLKPFYDEDHRKPDEYQQDDIHQIRNKNGQ